MNKLVWLRTDLRTHDNPALWAAMSTGPTMAVYCVASDQWDQHGVSPAKRSLTVRQLMSLKHDFTELNVPLIILNCHNFAGIPKSLTAFAQQHNVDQVFMNDEYELNERRCTQAAQQALQQQNIQSQIYVDQCMIAPGLITTKQGDMYKVFTAFKRAFLSEYPLQGRDCLPQPQPQVLSHHSTLPKSDLSAIHAWSFEDDYANYWPAGETHALQILDEFVDNKIMHYNEQRDFPSQDSTSSLSPYLAIGAVSTTQCIQAIYNATGRKPNEAKDGVGVWINELIWREFYRHLMFAFPDLCKHKPFKSETDALPWQTTQSHFNAWKNGQTGYPIVDAAMRQLNTTGWMHNRLRMVVAMFFTKHLFLDWRLGEAYFMSKLVDGDFASNNGGWQWSASTGVDAAPYFRIFNPVRQSERFDEAGTFIKRYLPELVSLNKKDVHMPSPQQANALNYPTAIVEHSLAVKETKHHFKQLSQRIDQHAQTFAEAKSA